MKLTIPFLFFTTTMLSVSSLNAQISAEIAENEKFIAAWFSIWDTGDVEGFSKITSKQVVDNDPNPNHVGTHYEGLKNALISINAAFSGGKHKLEQVYHSPDGVIIVRWEFEGIQIGEYAGKLPTGEITRFKGIEILKVTDGMLTEIWHLQRKHQ
ncbi:MAG: ester cyclase [Saprospiraceae bacterium]|nr:ester cyclase [Saprospiraceae bacterium]